MFVFIFVFVFKRDKECGRICEELEEGREREILKNKNIKEFSMFLARLSLIVFIFFFEMLL